MPLTLARANDLIQALNDALAGIGRTGETAMPRSKGNLEPIAYEFLVAELGSRVFEARKRKARAEGVKAGVIFDHEKQPLPIGTSNAPVYEGDVVTIAVSVGTPATRVDIPALVADLEKHLDLKVINRLLKEHTHENRAPHKFVASLCTKR